MTNEQQQSPIFRLDKLKKHLYNTIWGIKQLLTQPSVHCNITIKRLVIVPLDTQLLFAPSW
jgi:hypothetical protein